MHPHDMMGSVGVWAPPQCSPPWAALDYLSQRHVPSSARGITTRSCSEGLFAERQALLNTFARWSIKGSDDDFAVNACVLPAKRQRSWRARSWQGLIDGKRVTFADDRGRPLRSVCYFDQAAPPSHLRGAPMEPTSDKEDQETADTTPATGAQHNGECTQDSDARAHTISDNGAQHDAATTIASETCACGGNGGAEAGASLSVGPPSATKTADTNITNTSSIDFSVSFMFALMPRRDQGNVAVALTAVRYNECARAIEGTISCMNLTYHKDVAVRYSCDSWATVSEVRAMYSHSSQQPFQDFSGSSNKLSARDFFTFALPLADVQVGSRVVFAVRFTALPSPGECIESLSAYDHVLGGNFGGDDGADFKDSTHTYTYWDNNNNANFEALCTLPRVVR